MGPARAILACWVATGLLAPSAAHAQRTPLSQSSLVLPISDATMAQSAQVFAEGLHGALKGHGYPTLPQEAYVSAFRQRHSREPATLTEEHKTYLKRCNARALGHVAYGRTRQGIQLAQACLSEVDHLVEAINQDLSAEQDLLDTCMHIVRGHRQPGRVRQAIEQAIECRRLAPRARPNPKVHYPPAMACYRQAAHPEQYVNTATLTIHGARNDCVAYVDGHRQGNTPFALHNAPSGTYRVQVRCGYFFPPGRVHNVVLGAQDTSVYIDPYYDQAIRTDNGPLALEIEATDSSYRYTYAFYTARVLSVAHLWTVYVDPNGNVQINLINMQTGDVQATLWMNASEHRGRIDQVMDQWLSRDPQPDHAPTAAPTAGVTTPPNLDFRGIATQTNGKLGPGIPVTPWLYDNPTDVLTYAVAKHFGHAPGLTPLGGGGPMFLLNTPYQKEAFRTAREKQQQARARAGIHTPRQPHPRQPRRATRAERRRQRAEQRGPGTVNPWPSIQLSTGLALTAGGWFLWGYRAAEASHERSTRVGYPALNLLGAGISSWGMAGLLQPSAQQYRTQQYKTQQATTPGTTGLRKHAPPGAWIAGALGATGLTLATIYALDDGRCLERDTPTGSCVVFRDYAGLSWSLIASSAPFITVPLVYWLTPKNPGGNPTANPTANTGHTTVVPTVTAQPGGLHIGLTGRF